MRIGSSRWDMIAALVIVAVVGACTLALLVQRRAMPGPAPSTSVAAADDIPASLPSTTTAATAPTIVASPGLRSGTVLDLAKYPALAGFTPTRITLDLDQVSPPEAYAALTAVSPVAVQGPLDPIPPRVIPRVTIHLHEAPLLEGLLELRAQTGTSITQLGPGRVMLSNFTAPNNALRWCVAGPYAFAITRVEAPATFTVELLTEPMLAVAQVPSSLRIESALDDANRSVQVASIAPAGAAGSSGPMRYFTVRLRLPGPTKRIALLSGTAQYVAGPRTERITTSAPDQRVTRKIGLMDVEIQPLVRAAGAVTLRIRYSRGDMPVPQWSRVSLLAAALRPQVMGPGEEACPVSLSAPRKQGDDLTMEFAIRGNPHHVLLELPSEFRDVPAPFEFRDIPLP